MSFINTYVIGYLKYTCDWIKHHGFKSKVEVPLAGYLGYHWTDVRVTTRVFLGPLGFYHETKGLNYWRQAARNARLKPQSPPLNISRTRKV